MTLTPTQIDDIAAGIRADILVLAPYASRIDRIGDDMASGYAVQDRLAAQLVDSGARGPVAGYKVALNSAMLMQRFGVREPVSARLFQDQRRDSPAALRRDAYRQFAFEPEISALIASDIPTVRTHDRASVAAHIARLVPSLELLDMRDIDFGAARVPDFIAQNISNVGIAVGGPGIVPSAFDALSVTTTVTYDGQPVAEVTNAAPQHPLDVIAWMANHLAARGLALRAGMVVLCGTHTPIQYPPAAVQEIRVTMSGLGEVVARFG